MRKSFASITSTGAAPWKFLLLAATLLLSYAIPAHADDHEEAAVVEEAETLRNVDIAAELELPPQKIHCSVLAEDAIKEAIRNYQEKKANRQEL